MITLDRFLEDNSPRYSRKSDYREVYVPGKKNTNWKIFRLTSSSQRCTAPGMMVRTLLLTSIVLYFVTVEFCTMDCVCVVFKLSSNTATMPD